MEKMTLQQNQKIYSDFLEKNGYTPEVNEDNDEDEGDLSFYHEGTTYTVGIDEDDLEFFELVYIGILDYKAETDEKKIKLYKTASETTQLVKYAKVSILLTDKVLLWITSERIIDQPSDVEKYFGRMFESIQEAIEYFHEKMEHENNEISN
jgi:hypothetical protein